MLLVLIKAIIIYFLVLVCVRLTGKRQLGEMQPFELVIMLMIADLACIPINDAYIPIYSGIVPIIALTFLSIIISLIARKSLFARRLISGKSVMVIERGSVIYQNLKKMNLNMNDLLEALRAAGSPDINAIEYAIFENNGKICVINKPTDPTVPAPALLPMILMIDGEYNAHNIEKCGVKKQQLEVLLKKNGIANSREVLYMDIRQNGEVYVSPKTTEYFTDKLKIKGDW